MGIPLCDQAILQEYLLCIYVVLPLLFFVRIPFLDEISLAASNQGRISKMLSRSYETFAGFRRAIKTDV